MYAKYFKRPLDFVLSLLTLVALSGVMLITALLVRMQLGSPVIFCQMRPGKDEKIFKMYKFRSMTDARDEDGNLLPDDVRLTRFGSVLRSTSLDELPELFNILKGDMSIVGPRPLLVEYLPYYTAEEKKRHTVRSGLTGLAQVNGRNSITWERKFEYDLKYISNITIHHDIFIMMKTIGKVWRRDGIGQAEEAPECLHLLRQIEQPK